MSFCVPYSWIKKSLSFEMLKWLKAWIIHKCFYSLLNVNFSKYNNEIWQNNNGVTKVQPRNSLFSPFVIQSSNVCKNSNFGKWKGNSIWRCKTQIWYSKSSKHYNNGMTRKLRHLYIRLKVHGLWNLKIMKFILMASHENGDF